jgi:putative heme-binding domain-containing protein
VRALPIKQGQSEVRASLLKVAVDRKHREDTRLAALGSADELPPEAFDFVLQSVASDKPLVRRSAAAALFSRVRLTRAQLDFLLPSIKTASPLELPKLLAAYSRTADEELGSRLLATLEDAAAFSSLRPENVTSAMTNFPPAIQQQARSLVTILAADSAREKQRVDELLTSLKPGDIRRGQALFNSEKMACASCHAIGYLGGNVGPDLTRIGQIRTERDLMEAIVYPSASFVRSYEPFLISTKEGEDFSGILKKDAADEVVLVTGPNAEQRIARVNIVDMRPGSTSVMPGGLIDQLTKEDIADLLAFLKATRW